MSLILAYEIQHRQLYFASIIFIACVLCALDQITMILLAGLLKSGMEIKSTKSDKL